MPALPDLRRLPLPGSRLRRADRAEARPGLRRAEAHRRNRGAAARGDRPVRARRLLLPQQDGVLVLTVRRRSRARAAQGGPVGRGDRHREVLAHDRRRQRHPQRRARLGARGRARPVLAGRQHGLSPPPDRPRRSQHGTGARPARDGARREVRAGVLRRRVAKVPRGAVDPLGRERPPG